MLKSLDYHFSFTTSSVIVKGHIDFQSGLSSITGPNEKGKSMVLEAIRFALYGTEALRAALTSYKSIGVTLNFDVGSEDWIVGRTKSTAHLAKPIGTDGTMQMVATGVTPVNERIIKIFGYGLNVFDIAHFCGQGEVEKLTNMKPAERKKMVDRTIGMDALDTAFAAIATDKTALAAELKGMEAGLGPEPAPPVTPHGYKPSSVLQADIEWLEPMEAERKQIEGWVEANYNTVAPTAPSTTVTETAAELTVQEAQRDSIVGRQAELQRQFRDVPVPIFTSEELDAMERQAGAHSLWLDDVQYIQRTGPFPFWVTPQQLQKWQKDWRAIADMDDLHERIRQLKDTRRTCPKCGTAFVLDEDRLQELQEQYAAYGDVTTPPLHQPEIRALWAIHDAWAQRGTSDVHPFVPAPPVSIPVHRRALALEPVRKELQGIVIPDSVASRLRERQRYEDQVEVYKRDLTAYRRITSEMILKEARFTELGHVPMLLAQTRTDLQTALTHEQTMRLYREAVKARSAVVTALEAVRTEVDEHKKAGLAITLLRSKIKTFLVPSLNVAASDLISRMTGGVRSSIVVDENFERIIVDGQSIETLSGSAKAVANLAIRLGLGQVLTNRVFSVFLGDEIDASMDVDRSGFTAECLTNLNTVIKQIVLVSHKDLVVQHQIKIG